MKSSSCSTHQQRTARTRSDLHDWLNRRADGICGVFVPQIGDLFGTRTSRPDWQTLQSPLDRLAAFAADANNAPSSRREAGDVVELYQRSSTLHAEYADLAPSVLSPIGMLMLVPAE
ncbi:MAG TPA: hypothetical protein VFL55_13520 [Acetobacteraceae bacterium]|nr:hypothetical protein [Acetobacteraceae bacterium]